MVDYGNDSLEDFSAYGFTCAAGDLGGAEF